MKLRTEKNHQLSSRVQIAHTKAQDVYFHTKTERNLSASTRKKKKTSQTQRTANKNIVRLLKNNLKNGRLERINAFNFLRENDFQVEILCLDKLSIRRER